MRLRCGFIYVVSKFGEEPTVDQMIMALKDFADMGLEYVELEGVNKRHLEEVYSHRKELKNACDTLGLKVANFVPMIHHVGSLDSEVLEGVYQQFRLGVELASYFGCETMEIDSFLPDLEFSGELPETASMTVDIRPEFCWEAQWNSFVDIVGRCTQTAAEAGLRLGLHPRVGEIVSNTDALLRLIDAVDNEALGAVIDTAHLHYSREIVPLSIEKLANRIWHVHLSDNDGKELRHLAPGSGTIDWDAVFLVLKKNGFHGHLVIDVGGNVTDLQAECQKAKESIEDMVHKVGLDID